MKKPTTKKTTKKAAAKTAHKWDEIKYNRFAVNDLVDQIKSFNCGVIDNLLSEHVDRVFKVWLKKNK